MHQPLGLFALVYAAGLVLGYFFSAPIIPAFATCFGLLFAAYLIKPYRFILLGAAVFCSGWLSLTVRTAILSPHDLRKFISENAELVTVRGRLAQTPSQRVRIRDEEESWRTVAEIDVQEVLLRDGHWRPAFGRVLSVTRGTLSGDCFVNRKVEVHGALGRPPQAVLSGTFDYRRHLAARGVYFQLKVSSEDGWTLLEPNKSEPASARFIRWAQATLSRGLSEQDEALKLQWAMLLGWQAALTAEVSDPFMKSGTMHIFAISGLHIALIAGIFMALFRALMAPRWLAALFAIAVIWFYTAATGWQSSALRSTVMMTVVAVGWVLHRPASLLNSLVVAGLILLVWEPLQLFQASFQLSFFTVLSIALLAPRLELLETWIVRPDPMLPLPIRPAWQQWSVRCLRGLWRFFAVSLAASVGSMPFVAYYFNLFTPGSVLANLLVVPASAAALSSGMAALVTGSLAPTLTELFNYSGWAFMRLMVWLSEATAKLPGSWMHVRSPGVPEFLLYYSIVVALFTAALRRKVWRWVLLPSILILSIFIGWNHFSWRRTAEIAVLPLAGTHAVLARPDHRSRYSLFNCGPADSFAFGLGSGLKARGVNSLSRFVVARSDMPHAGALPLLLESFPPDAISISPQRSRSNPFRSITEQLLERKDLRLSLDATNGNALPPWRILHPAANDTFSRGQELAVCSLGVLGGVRVLLLPDLGPAGQNALFQRHSDIRAEIVIAGLPDRGEPLPDELLERIEPSLIVIADAEFPPARRATTELRERLARKASQVLYTRDTGELVLWIKDGRWRLEPARKVLPPGREGE